MGWAPKHPVLNTQAQMRRGATLLLPAASGAPLIRSTRELKVRRIWMDGTIDCDFDMIATPDLAKKYLPRLLRDAFTRLVWWKEQEGYVLAHFNPAARPPPRTGYRWTPMEGGRYWACGPFEKLVMGTVTGPDGEQQARRHTVGEERLNETGGLISYRVSSYFTVREHLAEVSIRDKLTHHRP